MSDETGTHMDKFIEVIKMGLNSDEGNEALISAIETALDNDASPTVIRDWIQKAIPKLVHLPPQIEAAISGDCSQEHIDAIQYWNKLVDLGVPVG